MSSHRRRNRELGLHKIIAVNSSDASWTSHRYVLWFGATGGTKLLVWGNSLEDALDEAVDYLADHKPGLLADREVHDEYKRLRAEGMSEEAAQEEASVDTTTAGNASNYLHSWEWGIVAEDPSREELLDLERRHGEKRAGGVDRLAAKRVKRKR